MRRRRACRCCRRRGRGGKERRKRRWSLCCRREQVVGDVVIGQWGGARGRGCSLLGGEQNVACILSDISKFYGLGGREGPCRLVCGSLARMLGFPCAVAVPCVFGSVGNKHPGLSVLPPARLAGKGECFSRPHVDGSCVGFVWCDLFLQIDPSEASTLFDGECVCAPPLVVCPSQQETIVHRAILPYERNGPDTSWMRVPVLLLGLLVVAITQGRRQV